MEIEHWPEIAQSFKCQPPKMAKHSQTIRQQQPTNCLSVFSHFVGLALKGLTCFSNVLVSIVYGGSHCLKYVLSKEYIWWSIYIWWNIHGNSISGKFALCFTMSSRLLVLES